METISEGQYHKKIITLYETMTAEQLDEQYSKGWIFASHCKVYQVNNRTSVEPKFEHIFTKKR